MSTRPSSTSGTTGLECGRRRLLIETTSKTPKITFWSTSSISDALDIEGIVCEMARVSWQVQHLGTDCKHHAKEPKRKSNEKLLFFTQNHHWESSMKSVQSSFLRIPENFFVKLPLQFSAWFLLFLVPEIPQWNQSKVHFLRITENFLRKWYREGKLSSWHLVCSVHLISFNVKLPPCSRGWNHTPSRTWQWGSWKRTQPTSTRPTPTLPFCGPSSRRRRREEKKEKRRRKKRRRRGRKSISRFPPCSTFSSFSSFCSFFGVLFVLLGDTVGTFHPFLLVFPGLEDLSLWGWQDSVMIKT